MKKGALLYEGKAKRLYQTDRAGVLLAEYLDQATALNGQKKDVVVGKGFLNNTITSLIFSYLREQGVVHHFIEQVSDTEQLIEQVTMIPLEVVVRNIASGSFVRRLGVASGSELAEPIVEFYYKNDALDDPFINDDHVRALNLATTAELAEIRKQALLIDRLLLPYFADKGIRLVDYKLEFGKRADGTIVLADEISPDTCRLWDVDTNQSLDKDNYRYDRADMVPIYQEVLRRLTADSSKKESK